MLFFLLCITIFLHTDAYEHFGKIQKKKTNHNYIHRTHSHTHKHYIHVLINNDDDNNNNNNNNINNNNDNNVAPQKGAQCTDLSD